MSTPPSWHACAHGRLFGRALAGLYARTRFTCSNIGLGGGLYKIEVSTGRLGHYLPNATSCIYCLTVIPVSSTFGTHGRYNAYRAHLSSLTHCRLADVMGLPNCRFHGLRECPLGGGRAASAEPSQSGAAQDWEGSGTREQRPYSVAAGVDGRAASMGSERGPHVSSWCCPGGCRPSCLRISRAEPFTSDVMATCLSVDGLATMTATRQRRSPLSMHWRHRLLPCGGDLFLDSLCSLCTE